METCQKIHPPPSPLPPNKYRGAPKDKGKKSVTVPPQKKCDRCLGNNHARKDYPAKDAICHACEKLEHYKKACRSKHIRQVTAYTDQVRKATDQMEELFLGAIESPNQETAWESKVFINNKKVIIKLSQYCQRNSVSRSFTCGLFIQQMKC